MNISIFGLGYVGCVSLGCLAKNGFNVIGVDVSHTKVNLINRGIPTIIEKDIDLIINAQHQTGRIKATRNYHEAVLDSDVSIICVGTPNTEHGDLDLSYIYQTAEQIAEALREKNTFHTIVIRSTVLPGTNEKVKVIIETSSGKLRNKDFAVVSNPEFLREGTAVEDYYNPPLTVIGTDCDTAFDIVASLYEKVSGPVERVDVKVAELIKYVNNSYHALKVVFANEVGNICKKVGIDSHELMRIFCMDKQLNISPYYFKPGFAYGGSCLPKDLKALKTLALDSGLSVPVLDSIEVSNQKHIELVIKLVLNSHRKKVGVLGVAFKDGTDDLRFSPMVKVVSALLDQNYDLKVYDTYVNDALVVGANREFVESAIPFLAELLCGNQSELILWADIIILNRKSLVHSSLIESNPEVLFIDLVRIEPAPKTKNYIGLSW